MKIVHANLLHSFYGCIYEGTSQRTQAGILKGNSALTPGSTDKLIKSTFGNTIAVDKLNSEDYE